MYTLLFERALLRLRWTYEANLGEENSQQIIICVPTNSCWLSDLVVPYVARFRFSSNPVHLRKGLAEGCEFEALKRANLFGILYI